MPTAPTLSSPITPSENELNGITWHSARFNPNWFAELGIKPRSILVIGEPTGDTIINYSHLFKTTTVWGFEQNKVRYKQVEEKLKKIQNFCMPVLVDFSVSDSVSHKCITMDWLTNTFLFTEISLLHINCYTALAIPVIQGMETLMPKLIFVNTHRGDKDYAELQKLLQQKKYTRVLHVNNYELFKYNL